MQIGDKVLMEGTVVGIERLHDGKMEYKVQVQYAASSIFDKVYVMDVRDLLPKKEEVYSGLTYNQN